MAMSPPRSVTAGGARLGGSLDRAGPGRDGADGAGLGGSGSLDRAGPGRDGADGAGLDGGGSLNRGRPGRSGAGGAGLGGGLDRAGPDRPGPGGGGPGGAAVGSSVQPARIKLATLPTPLVSAPNLGAAMGIERLYVKRDDLTGFAFGGNKARLLEFLVAAALEQGADTLVTGGAAASNFCATTAAAARLAGLGCHLLIAGESPQDSLCLDLARSWGATVTWTRSAERASVDTELPRTAAALAAAGRRPFLIPRGGATALGAIGYALAAGELHDQLAGRGLRADCVLVPVGSGGTLAGLLAGSALLGRPWRLVGASVSRPPEEAAQRVLQLARDCLALLTAPGHASGDAAGREVIEQDAGALAIVPGDIQLVDARGPGHGVASAVGERAADTALRTEGLVVDPVYTAKTLAVLRRLADEHSAVFWHTGGLLDAIAAAGRTGDGT
jgi:1-aminocyclopropane-1-carboxylate deaminase/D-cysteine desulfhydrase-like pyridoxal-dependent ACC family enzyme